MKKYIEPLLKLVNLNSSKFDSICNGSTDDIKVLGDFPDDIADQDDW